MHVGLIVGIGEFDPVSGALIQRIKESTVGELGSPFVGQAGSFSLDLSSSELASAGVDSASRIGVFLHHDDDGSLFDEGPSLRNDVYIVDNLSLVILGVDADTDGDGIGDVDEPGLGLDPANPADGALDNDGDGRSNFLEYLAGTDLDDGSDFLSADFSFSPGVAEFSIPGTGVLGGRVYILEQSTTLGVSAQWTVVDAVSGTAAGAGSRIDFQPVDPGPLSFYRVRVEWE